ncbi:MAG: hypothetical protein HOO96_13400 [Polyangiaceae bacterium]|nr:hypothetical protein [Polyangiaceae bacterium]
MKASSHLEGPVKRALRVFFSRVMRVYFRDIEVTGAPPEARTGGRIFVANHVNGLVDPVLVLTMCACPISPIAKSTLWNIPGLRWLLDSAGAVPIVRKRDNPGKSDKDNDAVFEKVAEHLGRGGNVLIFPEGTSHNEPKILPLKSGAARMLARARASGATGLSFQAVGLEFDARDTFRSRVLVVYGPVRPLDELGLEGDALVSAVVTKMREDLDDVLITADSWDGRILTARVATMFANDAGDASLEGWSAIGRRVETARDLLENEDPAAVRAVKDAVREYYARLAVAHTSDEIVSGAAKATERSRAHLALLPLAFVGVLLFIVPYRIPRAVAALAKGSPDVASTYKLGAGLVAYPLWLALLVASALYFAPAPWSFALVALVVVTPFAALSWLDRQDRVRSLGQLPSREVMESLQRERAAVMASLVTARDRVEGVAAEVG